MNDGQVSQVAKTAPQETARQIHVNAGGEFEELSLTPRELQVLWLVAQGERSRGIAAQLGLSERTVEVYRSHLKMKLRTKNVVELIKVALNNGFGEPKDLIGDR